MSLRTFQRLLADLVMSPDFRRELAEGDTHSLAGQELTPREKQRLLDIAKNPGLRTGTLIHRSFRLSMLANTLPRTCRLLGAKGLEKVVNAYWSRHLPRNYLYAREASRFASYVRSEIAAGRLDDPYLAEVLDTEMAMLELGKTPRWHPPSTPTEPPDGDWIPSLHPLCRRVAFRHEPEAVLHPLEEERAPNTEAEGDHDLLLLSGELGKVLRRSLPRHWSRVLRACDGERNARAAQQAAGMSDEDWAEAITALWTAGYLVRASRDGGCR